MTFLKIIPFFLSSLGLWEVIRRRFDETDISFIPGIAVAIQTTFLCLAGIFNILPEAVYFIYAVGFLCLAGAVYQDKNIRFIRQYMKPSIIFLGVSMVLLGLSLRGEIFTHYDNFTHWALVVRRILETNRFPNYKDAIITFQEYPVGSAAWIYFFSKTVSPSESMQMLAQAYMIMAGIIPLFSLGKKGWPLVTLMVASFANYILVYNARVTDLLVDTLLPLVSMSGLLYAVLYCKKGQKAEYCIPAAFYMIQITQIKNAGLFFVIIIACFLLSSAIKSPKKKLRLFCIASPFLSAFLWYKHCQYVFDSSEVSKHAMTAANYAKVFDKKAPEDISGILNALTEYISSWTDTWMTAGLIIIVLLCVIFFYREGRKRCIQILLLTVALFVVYQAGLFGMYVFSMPKSEAAHIAGIKRYEKTIVIAMIYIMMIPMIQLVSAKYPQKKAVSFIAAGIMAIAIFAHMGITQGGIQSAFFSPEKITSPETRNWIETAKRDYDIPDGEDYTMLIPRSDSGYAKYLCRYIFQSDSVKTAVVGSKKDMKSIKTKYILVYDSNNAIIRDWIQEHYPDQAGAAVVITE